MHALWYMLVAEAVQQQCPLALTKLLPIPPLQVAHHSLSEAGTRGGEGVEPEGLGADERSITSTSSRGARPQHPGHRRVLVTLWDALHRTPMAAQQGSSVWPAAFGVLSTPCFWPWSQPCCGALATGECQPLCKHLCPCGALRGPCTQPQNPPGCLSRQKRPSRRGDSFCQKRLEACCQQLCL